MKKDKKIFLITILICFMVNICIPCVYADNNNAQQIEKKRTEAKNKIKNLKLLERIETGKLYDNQKKLEKAENNLNNNKVQYENAKNELERLQSELQVQLREYDAYQQNTSKRIVQIYKSKRLGYIQFLLSAGDINDFLDRIYYENIIMGIDKKNMENAKARALTIRRLKQEMERKKSYLASAIESIGRQQENIQSAINKNERMINRLKTDRAAWEKSERELAKQSEQLSKFITKTVKNESTKVTTATGGFLRPVSGPVTSPFGSRMHPIFKRVINHTGVDLGMPMG